MFCYKCGSQNSDSATFCIQCGTRISENQQNIQKPKGTVEIVLLVLAGMIVFIFIIIPLMALGVPANC